MGNDPAEPIDHAKVIDALYAAAVARAEAIEDPLKRQQALASARILLTY